jgi:hypothetical protein
VSTYAEPRSAHGSSRILRCIEVDGKPSRVSNRNTETVTLSAAEWFAQLAPFNRDASLFLFLPQPRSFSTVLRLPNPYASAAPDRSAPKLFGLHELPSVTKRIALTTAGSPGYAGIRKGGSRCGDSAARASGSVPGTLDIQGKEARS